MEWSREQYNKQYEKWVPWLEDLYLRYFTNDNKASYTVRENLNKTKVTGIEQVDNLQDGINNLAAGQLGQGGLGQSAGDGMSKEGLNRAERQGRDDEDGYLPKAGGPASRGGDAVIGGAVDGAKRGAESAESGVEGVGGMLGLGN